MNGGWLGDGLGADAGYRFKVMSLSDDELRFERTWQTDPARQEIISSEISFRNAVEAWEANLIEQLSTDLGERMAPTGRWSWLRGRWGRS